MFLKSNTLNEGHLKVNNNVGISRELREGKNPRASNQLWQHAGEDSHSNFRWQKLRK